jgi:hypothetical protein
MAKYDPLKLNLINLSKDQNEITLTFEQIEKILEDQLPLSAYRHRAWWSNEEHGVHVNAHAWMDAGWRVDSVNQRERWVRFIRKRPTLQTKPKVIPVIPKTQNNAIVVKKTMYSANRPVRTLVVHKPECRIIPWEKLDPCGCGNTGGLGNQRWFCEDHVTIKDVDEFMSGRFWAILLCDLCFKHEI